MAYGFYASITVDNTKVSGSSNLTNFPVLVSGTYDGTGGEPDIRTTGNGGNVENTDATGGAGGNLTVPADLVFSSDTAGASPYDFEIQSYDATTGAIIAWVEIPTLDFDDDTVFYMVYGDSGVTTSQEDVAGTWDANYLGVWHLSGSYDGTADEVKDSSGNGFHGVVANTPTQATAKIGNGQDLEKDNSEYIDIGGEGTTLELVDSKYTFQIWCKPESFAVANHRLINMDDGNDGGGGYSVFLNNTDSNFYFGHNTGSANNWDTGKDISTGSFVMLTVVYDQTNRLAYVDGGGEVTTSTTTDLTTEGNDPLWFGGMSVHGQYFDGIIDEVRISNTNRTSDYIATDYNTQNSPSTFYTVGSETVAVNFTASPGLHVNELRPGEIITKLKADTGTPENNLSDQNTAEFGSNRWDDIRASIGDNGQSFKKLYYDYIHNL